MKKKVKLLQLAREFHKKIGSGVNPACHHENGILSVKEKYKDVIWEINPKEEAYFEKLESQFKDLKKD